VFVLVGGFGAVGDPEGGEANGHCGFCCSRTQMVASMVG
jgi:hypothetical protein